MADSGDRPGNQNGVFNVAVPGPRARTKPFSLREALPYSPFTATVPYLADYVPEPSIGFGNPAPAVTDLFDSSQYDAINQEASAAPAGHSTGQVRHAIDSILHDLRPMARTHCKFRAPSMDMLPVTKPAPSLAAGLSPLAKAVHDKFGALVKGGWDSAALPTAAPAASSDGLAAVPPPSISGQPPTNLALAEAPVAAAAAAAAAPPLPPSPAAAANAQAYHHNSAIEIEISPHKALEQASLQARAAATPPPPALQPGHLHSPSTKPPPSRRAPPSPSTPVRPKHTPTKPKPSPSSWTISVELGSAPINKDEFIEIDVADLPDLPQKNLSRRKDNATDYQTLLATSMDRQQSRQATLSEFATLTREINAAIAHAHQPSQGPNPDLIFTADGEPTLRAAMHQKVQALIHKIIDLGAFEQVPLDDLLQHLKLCENTLQQQTDVSYQPEELWQDSEIESWVYQLAEVEVCLKAARTALRIMSGNRKERQLYSEHIIQLCLTTFKEAINRIVIPIVELRSGSPLFRRLTPHKKAIGSVFTACQRVYAVIASVISTVNLSSTITGPLEFEASRLMFVDNGLHEKDSVVGVQKFDGIRLVAMDMLCQIFRIKVDTRAGLLNELFSSIEKMPVGRHSARQFKLTGGGSIQPVSALVMRLIQASATMANGPTGTDEVAAATPPWREEGEGGRGGRELDHLVSADQSSKCEIKYEDMAAASVEESLNSLQAVTTELVNAARNNADHVVHLLVKRAMSATKSGDAPYRVLLDQFVDDFTLCLSSPDWPAAELILRQLNSRFIQLISDEKSSAPCKNMALELMGGIGAAISKLRLHVRKTIGSACLAGDTDDVGRIFSELARSALQRVMTTEQLVSWEGPYRATVEYLQSRCSDDPYLTGAISLIVAEWSEKACRGYDSLGSENRDRDDQFGRLAYRLGMMVKDPAWLSASHEFDTVCDGHARLAYAVTLIQSRLFDSFNTILSILLSSMGSDQATVRNKSLKSINQMIETDPSILQDTNSILTQLTIRCDGDSSTQVRDSALTLIGKCLLMLPEAEDRLIGIVTGKFQDGTVGIRKRAMKLARDAYLRTSDPSIRIKIAPHVLARAHDQDETVRDLARQIIEEIWFAPFYGTVADAAAAGKDAAYRTALSKHIAVMVSSISKVSHIGMLDRLFWAIINEQPQQGSGQQQSASQQSRQNPLQVHVQSQPPQAGRPVTGPFAVCAELVAALFEIVNQGGELKHGHILYTPPGRGACKMLMLLARAEPGLFTFEQIKLLQPHLNITVGSPVEEVAIFRAVAAIYRHVLPRLSAGTHSQFLIDILIILAKVLGKVPIGSTEDLVVCMWTISKQLLQDLGPFGRLISTAVHGIRDELHNGLEGNGSTPAGVYRLQRFITVMGMAGRYCNELKIEMKEFSKELPDWESGHLSQFLIKSVMPAMDSAYITPVRLTTLNAIGLICQAAPRNFADPDVHKVFADVFKQGNPHLESSVLKSFQHFLIAEEQRAEAAQQTAAEAAAAADNNTTTSSTKKTAPSNNRRSAAAAAATADTVVANKRKLAVMGGTSYDDVTMSSTQFFIPEIKRIAISSQTADAIAAVELLASISRQGIVHPTQVMSTFLVLETSTQPRISDLALQEHRTMHQRFETVLERDYVKAVHEVFAYQRDIVKDLRGATTNPFRAKLHLIAEVIRTSTPRKRQAFYNRLCRRLEFDPAKLDVGDGSLDTVPDCVLLSRFIIDNLIFFEYQSIGEVIATAATMEKMVVLIGNPLAHRLESELFKPQTGVVDAAAELDGMLQYPTPTRETSASLVASPILADVSPVRLRQLASGAVILYALWEARTYLRRLYGLDSNRRDGKTKASGKDNFKPPVKVQGVHGDKIWDEIEHITTVGLQSTAAMVERCQAFVDLINIDSEFRSDADQDDYMVDLADMPTTPSDSGRADVADDAPEPGSGRGRKRKAPGSATPVSGRKKQARASSKPSQPPRPRGRPRKNPLPPPLPTPRQSGEQESPDLE